jgi:hypothetical protein
VPSRIHEPTPDHRRAFGLTRVRARAVTGFSTSSSPGCASLRRARFPAPLRAPLLPSARSARAAPTRAHIWIGPVAMSRSPQSAVRGQRRCLRRGIGRHRDGGGAVADCGSVGAARGAPIPSTVDPGKAEQTRPRASRSFVQWRAPPGRPEPRPLHGVWVDGGRDGSWGLRKRSGCGGDQGKPWERRGRRPVKSTQRSTRQADLRYRYIFRHEFLPVIPRGAVRLR